MAPNSSSIAWKIPWTEEPGSLQSMGSQRVGHDLVTEQSMPKTYLKTLNTDVSHKHHKSIYKYITDIIKMLEKSLLGDLRVVF